MTAARYKLLGGMMAFAAAGLAIRTIVAGSNPLLGMIVAILIMLGMAAFAFADWRLMDEVSRQANTTAYFWGTVGGYTIWAIGLSSLILWLGIDHLVSFWGHQGSLAIFALGGLSTMIVSLCCSLMVLGGWWVSKR
ncbi:MAG TPA: hypothetical protein VF637_03990 [Sphingomicrobium sp.]|jgi:hypothetical protein